MRFASPSRRLLSRLLCTLPQKLTNVHFHLRDRVLKEARSWLTEYFHSERAIPFSHANSIVSHAPFALSAFVAQVPFPSSTARADLKRIFRRFLTYHPVNEYDFFFESIGLPPSSSSSTAASAFPSYFLSDDSLLLAAVSALVHYGFPWTKLGLLYREEPRIFSSDSDKLISRLRALEARGFHRACIIGICLTFPSALSGDADPGGEIDHLFQYLNKVFLKLDLSDSVPENNVDIFLQVCRNIRVFYDLDSRKGTMGELMCKNLLNIFLELDDALIAQKLKFFINLGMEASEAGHFILKHADLFNIDLENSSILMPEYLKSVGLEEDKVALLSRKFPFAMGKNKLGNLPATMKAMNLHKWFLGKILNGNQHYLSSEFVLAGSHDTALESGFCQGLERLKCAKREQFLDKKVEFMQSIGFGENKLTLRSISVLKGPNDQLQERFDCLLELGVEYSVLCRMVCAKPLILNQCKDTFHEKVNFLCNDLGYSVEYLEKFPAFLCFGLENRTKPRYKMLDWLTEQGLLKQNRAPSTILSFSEKEFMTFLHTVHPAAPKHWLECYASRGDKDGNQRTLFTPVHKNQA
ncbi:transcription termination factor MTEF18, mitochondrial-like [Curcuma longa]|uniref:transcription termination factor MTEF18, mitochondrial-like n=1 Tax=Curcuma longa TaxID=136217 RepID=UPI003D9F2771